MCSCVSVVSGWMLVWLLVHCATINNSLGKDECRTTPEGDIRVVRQGTISSTGAGRMQMCTSGKWREVCTDGWDEEDAMVVCRQLGFPTQGTLFCTNSCFGRSNLGKGVRNFECTGREERLIACPRSNMNNNSCRRDAGIVCMQTSDCPTCPAPSSPPPRECPTSAASYTECPACPAPSSPPPRECPTSAASYTECPACPAPSSPPPRECPTSATSCADCLTTPSPTLDPATVTSCPNPTHVQSDCACPSTENLINATTHPGSTTPTPTSMIIAGGKVQAVKTATYSCVAVGGGVGVLAAILMVILVGVVLGWGWYCHRMSRRGKSNIQLEKDTNSSTQLQNPTYSSTCASTPQPSAPYSTLGPRDTPLNCSPTSLMPTAETTFATYDIVEGDYHMLGAGDYHVLEEPEGMTYEVPILSKATANPTAAAKVTDEEYSTLQHQ